jgi:hypothetical protein
MGIIYRPFEKGCKILSAILGCFLGIGLLCQQSFGQFANLVGDPTATWGTTTTVEATVFCDNTYSGNGSDPGRNFFATLICWDYNSSSYATEYALGSAQGGLTLAWTENGNILLSAVMPFFDQTISGLRLLISYGWDGVVNDTVERFLTWG